MDRRSFLFGAAAAIVTGPDVVRSLLAEGIEVAPVVAQEVAACETIPVYTAQWFRNGIAIPGATDLNYRLTDEDKGQEMCCLVTGFNEYGSAGIMSETVTSWHDDWLDVNGLPTLPGPGPFETGEPPCFQQVKSSAL